MKKKVIAAFMAAAMMVTALTGCGGKDDGNSGTGEGNSEGSDAQADAPKEPFGDTVKYDPGAEINEGKDITIELGQ